MLALNSFLLKIIVIQIYLQHSDLATIWKKGSYICPSFTKSCAPGSEEQQRGGAGGRQDSL